MSSLQTFSSEATLREVRVIRILWTFCRDGSVSSRGGSMGLGGTNGGLAEVLLALVVRHLDGWWEEVVVGGGLLKRALTTRSDLVDASAK